MAKKAAQASSSNSQLTLELHPASGVDTRSATDGPCRPQVTAPQRETHHFTLELRRRKTICISVDNGRVLVRAPLYASTRDIERFVREKTAWIDRQLQDDARRQREIIRLADGARFSLLGQPQQLRLQNMSGEVSRTRAAVREQEGEITIALTMVESAARQEQLERLFRNWLTRRARPYLEQHSRQLAQAMGLQHKLGNFSYRFTRSKWGHCTSEGYIQYDPRVVLAPRHVVDYIIAHEVSHLRHRNHSASFWKHVERSCPGWRDAERWLKDNGHRAEFSAAPLHCHEASRTYE